MSLSKLVESWKREEQQPFTGWDFSYLDNRMIEEQAPWSYSTRAAELMRQASAVVDLGTGGGLAFVARKYLIEANKVTPPLPQSAHT